MDCVEACGGRQNDSQVRDMHFLEDEPTSFGGNWDRDQDIRGVAQGRRRPTDISCREASDFLSSGLASRSERLLGTADRGLWMEDPPGCTQAAAVWFAWRLLSNHSLDLRYIQQTFLKSTRKSDPKRQRLEAAMNGGTAIIIVKTHLEGYTGNVSYRTTWSVSPFSVYDLSWIPFPDLSLRICFSLIAPQRISIRMGHDREAAKQRNDQAQKSRQRHRQPDHRHLSVHCQRDDTSRRCYHAAFHGMELARLCTAKR